MGHHRTHVVSALGCCGVLFCGFVLGHCGVQFRQMESGVLRTQLGFSFGALWGAVQADEIYSPQDLLGFSFRTLWGSVQADRRWVTA